MGFTECVTRLTCGRYYLQGILFVLLSWSALTYTRIIPPIFLPTPSAVFVSFVVLFRDFGLLADIRDSIFRIFLGFALATVIAVPLGFVLAMCAKLNAFLAPILTFVRYIPPSAFIPLCILWFGIGNMQKIFVIFISVLPYFTVMVVDVVTNTRQEYTDVARTLGAKAKDILFYIILPQAAPGIWDSARIMLGVAWSSVVIAEIVASTSGLGHLIIVSQRFLQTANIVSALLIIGTIGVGMDLFFRFTYKILFPWTERAKDEAYD